MGGPNFPNTMAEMLSDLRQRVGVLERRGGGSLVGQLFPSPYVVADLDSLGVASNFIEGAWRHVDSLNVDFQVQDGVWVQRGVATVASTSDRDTEYAKASAAYRIAGVECLVTADLTTYRRVGSNWVKWHKPLAAWTPSITNVTIGNGTLSGFYSIADGIVSGFFAIVRGSSTSGTDPRVVWPETPHSSILVVGTQVGRTTIRDASAAANYDTISLVTSTLNAIQVAYTNATDGQLGGLGAAVPFSWTTSDTLRGDFSFPIENSF